MDFGKNLTLNDDSDCASSLPSSNWTKEIECTVQKFWGDAEKTNSLRSIWTTDSGVAAPKPNDKERRSSESDVNRFVLSSEIFTPYIHYQANSSTNIQLDSENFVPHNDPGLNTDASKDKDHRIDVKDISAYNNFHLDAEVCTAFSKFCLDSENCYSSNNFRPDFENRAPSNNNNNTDQDNCGPCSTFHANSVEYSSSNNFLPDFENRAPSNNNNNPDQDNCDPCNDVTAHSVEYPSSSNFRPDFENRAPSSNDNNPDQGNWGPCNEFTAHSLEYSSSNQLPSSSQTCTTDNNFTGNLTSPGCENNLVFTHSSPNDYTEQILNPVAPEFTGNIVPLVQCFSSLISHDLEIKACEKLMGISSLNHPVQMPQSYKMEEIEKLVTYSEKQLEFFMKFVILVEERFKNEEKRMEASNKYIGMWNELRGDRWDEGSFEEAIVSTADRIKKRWSKTNNILNGLLIDNGRHLITNLELFPAYFKDLETVVMNSRTAIWAVVEKIKMQQGVPDPEIDFSEYVMLLPTESNDTNVPAVVEVDRATRKRINDENYRQYRGRRRGKNFKKF